MLLVMHDRVGFSGKKFFTPKISKLDQKWAKRGFCEFIKKFGHQFLLNWFYNENLYYLLSSCTNLIFVKIFVPQIQAKMFSANQIAGFFNRPNLLSKPMKQHNFLYVDTNSHKLKVDQKLLGGHCPKWKKNVFGKMVGQSRPKIAKIWSLIFTEFVL